MAAQGSAPAIAKRRAVDYSKKYWWLGAIVIPILVAVIAKLPFGSDSPVPGTTYIASMTVIENEYQAVTGKPLNDPDLRAKIQQAIELGQKHYFDQSAKLFQEVAEKASIPAIYTDLGVAFQGANKPVQAQDAYKKALEQNPEYPSATGNLRTLEAPPIRPNPVSVSDHEVEPNNDFFHANLIRTDTPIAAAIADESDVDFYSFTTPKTYRDLIEIVVDNRSTTLEPMVTLYDSNKKSLASKYESTGGADVSYRFASPPVATYFVSVSSYDHTSGAYQLSVRPLHAYDSYEPNDDILHASPISVGNTISAEIMDGGDVDYYVFKATKTGSMTAVVENTSTTLAPVISLFNKDKTSVPGNTNQTAGGNVSASFSGEAGSLWYVSVSAYAFAYDRSYGTHGTYKLTIENQ